MKRKVTSILLAIAMVLSLVGCGSGDKAEKASSTVSDKKEEAGKPAGNETTSEEVKEDEELLSGIYAVLIEVEEYGDIFVELDADAAPITVTNFMKLVNEEYYTGLTFHRIIEGFMMQGGQSMDKPADNIKGEFATNGFDNPISHERGVISMARANDPNSASSQFFICHQDSFFLDGQYAAFGHVVSGMDVVDKICEEAIVVDNNGTVMPENQPIIKEIVDVTAEYRADALGEAPFEPMNELEAELGTDTFDSYDDVISSMGKGMAYAYVDILGSDEPVLLACTEGVYDIGDGKMAAISATPYLKMSNGKVRSGSYMASDGTAYPLAVLDGVVYCGANHTMEGYCISGDYEDPGIMALFYLYESVETDGSVTYGGFIRDTNSVMTDGTEVATDDDKPLKDAFEAYSKANPIEFTVIE